jgi:amino acid adenylation domain-containing protein
MVQDEPQTGEVQAAPSFRQRRQWLIEQLVPGAPVHVLAWRVEVSGPVGIEPLRRALAALVTRHEALRTSLVTVHDGPMQRVAAAANVPLAVVDLSTVQPAKQAARVAELSRADAGQAFDLADGPLLRVTLLRLAPDRHVLAVTAHQAVLDWWSVRELAGELAALHQAYRAGRSVPAGEAPGRPRDITDAYRAAATTGDRDGRLAFWRASLADVPPLELPTDRPRHGAPRYLGALVRRPLTADTVDGLGRLAATAGVDLRAVVTAGVVAVLHRHAGQSDFAVGVMLPGAGTTTTLGPLARMLVLRLGLSGAPSFRGLLRSVHAGLAEAARHEVPFEWLVEVLDPPRDRSRHPLVQCAIAVDTDGPPRLPGLHVTAEFLEDTGAAPLDLTVEVSPAGQGLALAARFSTELFRRDNVERMLEHLQVSLAAAVADPDAAVADLPLMSAEERGRVIVEWNDTAKALPAEATSVQAVFEAQVRRDPSAPAAVAGSERLSRGELNERANRLAHFLRARGVGPESLVGICLERSLDVLVALLGVIKAGGAYVPLDPTNPADRIAFMLADAAAPIVLTQQRLRDAVPDSAAEIVSVDLDWPSIAGHPADDPPIRNRLDDLAYVIYTSGSTGRPKGVEITHRGVLRLVVDTDFLTFAPQTVFLQVSPLSFDVSAMEILGPLLNGGSVVMLPPGVPSPAVVGRALRDHGVTGCWLGAPLFHLMLDSRPEDLTGLRELIAGGDVLSLPHVRAAYERLPGCVVIDGYGPTEATAITSAHRVTRIDQDWPSVPIGRPIRNTQVYVLDDRLRPAPIGVVGELYVGGPGVARGYHGRPALTAERFLPDPFSGRAGARLYRTGDLVRWLPEGNLQFLGRTDAQVKIDGIRIELGEIQTAVAAHPAVREAAIIVRELDSRRGVAAYIVLADPAGTGLDELRDHLHRTLPSAMLPSWYVVLDALPITPNGKVDYRALPEPSGPDAAEYRPPETPTEESLAEIWHRVLGVERVGRDDDLFALGGRSLHAIQVVTSVAAVFGVELTVQDVFDRPTLGGLAGRVEERMLTAVTAAEVDRWLAELDQSQEQSGRGTSPMD